MANPKPMNPLPGESPLCIKVSTPMLPTLETSSLNLRQVWSGHVTPADYEQHMSAIGQAQANAVLVRQNIERWAAVGARLLIAGAGTGQMFDYEAAVFLAPYDVTFSDINEQFLATLAARLQGTEFTSWRTQSDDLEQTILPGSYDLLIVVLVLEHIDWRKGVRSIARLAPPKCLIIIQVNPPGMTTAVTPTRVLPGTMRAVVAAGPRLVDSAELTGEMAQHGYQPLDSNSVDVPDGKQMLALAFERLTS
jgi:hypothetical protein